MKIKPSKEFLKAIEIEEKRLVGELNKLPQQDADENWKETNEAATTYKKYLNDHHYGSLMAVSFYNFINTAAALIHRGKTTDHLLDHRVERPSREDGTSHLSKP